MISFRQATDSELVVIREAIDALALVRPELIHEDEACSAIVHEVMGEIFARATAELAR